MTSRSGWSTSRLRHVDDRLDLRIHRVTADRPRRRSPGRLSCSNDHQHHATGQGVVNTMPVLRHSRRSLPQGGSQTKASLTQSTSMVRGAVRTVSRTAPGGPTPDVRLVRRGGRETRLPLDPPQRIERPGSPRGDQSGEVRRPWRTYGGGRGLSGWASGWAARIWRTARGSSTVAITRSRPPQRGQANTSIANAHRMRAAHVQLRGGGGETRALRGVRDGGLGRRPTIAHDLAAPARMRRKHPAVNDQVDLGPGRQRGQLREELEGLEHEVRCPIAPAPLQLDGQPPIRPEAQTVLGERGVEQVSAEMLQPGAIVGGHPHVRVQIKAVQVSLARPAGAAGGSVGSPPRRPTWAPACWPRATRPWTRVRTGLAPRP